MGNVLEHASTVAIEDADVIEEDLKWLGVKGSMMFNDDFLEEEYNNLPLYDGTEIPPDPDNVPGGSSGLSSRTVLGPPGDLHREDTVRRMLQLLAPEQELSNASAGADMANGTSVGTSVEDFPLLLGDTYLRTSTHFTATRMRSRLFQRIHLALIRQAYRAMTSLAAEAGAKARSQALAAPAGFALPPPSSAEGQGESDPAAILTSASMRMSLTLMGALRSTVPGLFASMAQTLMDLFTASVPFALGQLGSSSAYLETLLQVREVAEGVATAQSGSSVDERAQAAALLLSLGVATGSVSDVVRVAKLLLEKDAPSLPSSAKTPVERMRDHVMPPKVSIPRPNAWTASFPARLNAETEGGESNLPGQNAYGRASGGNGAGGTVAPGDGCSNPATDGMYVYVWHEGSKQVHKVGTGFHGTLAGNVYCSSKRILDDIRAFKGMEPARVDEGEEDRDEAATGQVGVPEAPAALGAPPRETGSFGGVIVSEAAAARRRSFMGTGWNIGGGLGIGADDSDESIQDDGFETGGSVMSSYLGAFGSHSAEALSAPPPLPPQRDPADQHPSAAGPSRALSSASSRTGVNLSPGDVQLHRVPNLVGRASVGGGSPTTAPATTGVAGSPVERPSRSRSTSPARPMDAILGAMGTMRARQNDARVGVAMAVGAGTVGSLAAGREGGGGGGSGGGSARGNGLLRFRALEDRILLHRVPESGFTEADGEDLHPGESTQTMLEDDEGEIVDYEVVHGLRWYKLRVTTRAVSTESLSMLGWVPLRVIYESECGSMDSEEKGELDGEEVIEILDPTTGEVIEPDSTRAFSPPIWDDVREASAAAVQDFSRNTADPQDPRASRVAAGEGHGVAKSVLRPVWLALAGGKLFLREKASGALTADEIAVLLPADLSLEGVVSLADLPIVGFPKSSRVLSESRPEEDFGEEEEGGADTLAGAGLESGVDEGVEEEADIVEFAYTELGASVVECSSNSETSEGILQNNLLVRDESERQPFPSSGSSGASPHDVAFAFAPADRDRVLVVDLGRARRIREAGVHLFPYPPGISTSVAVQSLLVETSLGGVAWTVLGWWTPYRGTESDLSAKVTAVGREVIARFVRYTLAPPMGTSIPPCFLSRLSASGSSKDVPEGLDLEGDTELPFPAMTTDSRHIILICVGGGERKDKEVPSAVAEFWAAAEAAAGLNNASPRRLELFFLDPEDSYRLVRTATLPWDITEADLHKSAVLCDGERLVTLLHKDSDVVKRTADTAIVSMYCRSGAFSASDMDDGHDVTNSGEDMEFDVRTKGGLAPTGLGYDRRNNVMWGWDSVLKKLCRWRSDGLPPVFAPPRPAILASAPLSLPSNGQVTSDKRGNPVSPSALSDVTDWPERSAWTRDMLASASPSHRVEALEVTALLDASEATSLALHSKRQAALLLGYMERLGEPYGPPEEDAAEARARCELEAASGGKDDGDFSRLLVRGEDRCCKEPGINVLILTENMNAGTEAAKGFATHESLHAANQLAEYLNAVPIGRTVLIAVQENAAGNLNNSVRKALLSVGAGKQEVAALREHRRSSFAMIGRKGAVPGSVPQVLRLPKKGCATIRQRLPAPKVPLCVDVSKDTFRSLIDLVLQHKPVLLQHSHVLPSKAASSCSRAKLGSRTPDHEGGESAFAGAGGCGGAVGETALDAAVALSAINILTNQIFQLMRGSTPTVALESFSSDLLTPLLALLIAVIDQDQPAVEGHDHRSTSSSQCAESGTVAVRKAAAISEVPSSTDKGGRTVERVSCTAVTGGATLRNHGKGESTVARGREGVEVASGMQTNQDLLQRACLRLFVTGMDLFFPSCAQRCSLLARYLSQYVSDGLSPAREAILELLLRRMSDPGQLVELVSHIPHPPDANAPSAGATTDAQANPFVIPGPVTGAENSASMNEHASSGGADVAKTTMPMVAAPSPSAIELQCLLLSVATAEGVSKIKALQRQGIGQKGKVREAVKESGRRNMEEHVGQGGVGGAAVEMLGRLTNQLLSSAACVITESDIGAFQEDCEEEVENFLQAIGVAGLLTPAAANNTNVSRKATTTDPASSPSSDGCNVTARPESIPSPAIVAGSVERRWVGTDVSAAGTLVVLVTAICRSCITLASQATEAADAIGEGPVDARGTLRTDADRVLQESPLGALLPMLASSLTLLVETHGVKIQNNLSAMAREVIGVMVAISEVLKRVPKDRLSVAGVSKGVGTFKKSVVMESKHNYDALTDEMLFLEIKGAAKMVVTFDDRSRTEDSYDYLIFWKDESKRESWHPRISKYSGTGSSCNFPGFGGRAPLVIESDRCWIEWRTDGSNEDWGWKFTATAEIKKVASRGDGGGYWLLGLDRQLAGAGAALAGCLVISKPWGGKAEDDNAPWMEDDLLAGTVSPEAAAAAVAPSPKAAAIETTPPPSSSPSAQIIPGQSWGTGVSLEGSEGGLQSKARVADSEGGGTGESACSAKAPCPELQLLLEVANGLEGTDGSTLCKLMRAKVGEDQGSVEAVNRAVYATCAALLWHQGLGVEALAVVEGRVTNPSKALSKAWRFGQKMRQFFDYGDVRDAVNSQMELQRKQAAALETSWKSSTSVSLDDAMPSTRPILTRGPSVYQGAEEKVVAEVSQRIISRALFLLSLPSQATRVSLQEQSKRRWSILAKLGGVGRTPSQSNYLPDGAELLEKWKEVVDEATAMRKLKSILVYRRKAAEKREMVKENSVSERIMKFAQCPADVSELEMVRQCRDQRAKLRAEGLQLTRALVEAAGSSPAKAWLLSSHARSVRLTKREDRPGAHVHYLSSVEGCEQNAYLALARQFALLFKTSLKTLKGCARPVTGETPAQAAERRALAVSSLQALALDYDLGDHDILKESVLLEVLEPLLQGFNEPEPTETVDSSKDEIPPGVCSTPLELMKQGLDSPPMEGESAAVNDDDNGDGDSDGDEGLLDTGSIGQDIAALEAELEEEEGLLLEEGSGYCTGEALSSQLPGGKEGLVRKAAWCLFEVLLPRCVGLEGQRLETKLEEPTSFSHRLLAVLIRQVGRASANVQQSNRSLGICDSDSTLPPVDVDTAAVFPKETPLLQRGMRLRRDEPGRAAPHRDMSVRHTLSLWLRRDLCLMDTKPGAWYAPAKVGDIVARGPKWQRGDMSDGGPGGLGTVIELIQSSMTAKVLWNSTGYEGMYRMGAIAEVPSNADDQSAPASVDDLLVWEVVKVDPAVGGSLVMKGAINNLTQEERSEPWSRFGLSLMGDATLMYYASAGEDQLFSVHSRTVLPPDAWTHVAVVQAKSRCRIYIDGEEDAEGCLPKHMLTPGGMVKDVLESQHPYDNNMDKVWDVHVEGAVSYSVTFDPLTKTEANLDFVRFLKDAGDPDGACFGEDRYSGGRNGSESNWPGVAGRPPLIINAPRFAVYFHTDGSNNDWGFKLTSCACVSVPEELDEDNSEASTANLNTFPVYLGQPPAYVSSQRSASGYLWGASTYAEALTAEQVRCLARAPSPPEPSFMEEEACTDVLSLAHRCASSMDGVDLQSGGLSLEAGASPLVSPQVLGPLLVILLQGSLKLRLAAARLCERLLPQAHPEMVQVQLSRAGLSPRLIPYSSPVAETRPVPFVRTLMLQLGEALSVWSRPAAATAAATRNSTKFCPPRLTSKESLNSGEEAFALASAHVGLLRAMLAKDGWSAPLVDCLREAISDLPGVTKALKEAGMQESKYGCTETVAGILCDPKLWMIHACLALLGGIFQGLHVGGRAMALMGDGNSATIERCTVLAMDWPGLHHVAAIERETSAPVSKSNKGVDFVCPAKEWEGLQSLGDAVIVCLHSEPDTTRVLPRGRVSPDSTAPSASFLSALKNPCSNLESPGKGGSRELSAAAKAAIAAATAEGTPGLVPYVPEGLVAPLVEAFGVLSASDASDKRVRHKPRVVETDEERIIESPHPHRRGVDEVYPLDFPGADSIQLFFDEDCRTEEGTAYIRIYKDESRTVIWGESMYQGRDKDANWPGLHGRPAVCVPASNCVIKFHSEDRNPDWGFRITAKAKCRSFTLPPERPPLSGTSALSMLQACGAKALVTLVTSWPQFVPHAQPLIKSLAKRAFGSSNAQTDIKKKSPTKKVVLESDHPYSHHADRKETVRIEGAKKLLISFDDRSRTEHGCDFMIFYADASMSKVYGENKYTGGKDGHQSNWPGMGGRPPLEIPSNQFFFRWQTDGSVNDWGWRMTVTPVMDKMDPSTLPPPMLDSKLASLLRICRDYPKEQPPALGLEIFEEEKPTQSLPEGRSLDPRHPPSSPSSLVEWSSYFAQETAKAGLPNPSKASMPTFEVPKVVKGAGQYQPRVFVVNPRDAEEVSLREAPRNDSAEVGRVSVNTHLLVVNETGDWLSVIPIAIPVESALRQLSGLWHGLAEQLDKEGTAKAASAGTDLERNAVLYELVTRAARTGPIAGGKGDAEMWALRRQGDMLYLVPSDEASSHLVTLPDEGDRLESLAYESGGAAKAYPASSGPTVAAFQVMDPPQGEDTGPASRGAFGIQAGDELANESRRLWSSLAETSHATATRFSRMALSRILAGSTEASSQGSGGGVPSLVLDDFGGPHMFLTLLRATFAEACQSGKDVDTAALEVMKNYMLGAVRQKSVEGRKVADMLLAFSLNQLTMAESLAKFLVPTKAVVKTFETAHNYADNTNIFVKISFPGAKRIRVVFDEKCSTEMGCDFVRIYKDANHNSYWGEHKYHGPASSPRKVWAGVGGRPPLMVEANSMEVNFFSDSSNNDWGVRMYAYGIMQEPSAHQRAAYREKWKKVGDPEIELASWLLGALTKESEADYVKSLIYQRATMETLTRFMGIADSKSKIWVVHLLTSLLQDACPPKRPALPEASQPLTSAPVGQIVSSESTDITNWLEAMFEPGGPVCVLLKLAKKEARLDEKNGSNIKSPLLQALVQACVVAEECHRKRPTGLPPRNGEDASFPRWPQRASTERYHEERSIRSKPKSTINTAPVLAVPGYATPASKGGQGMMRWHIKVLGTSASGPRIGIGQPRLAPTAGNSDNTGEALPWFLSWNCTGNVLLDTGNEEKLVSFGPPVKAGDTITVEVNTLKNEVRFYRNQALVGLAFGRSGSNASVEHDEIDHYPWRDGEAVHLGVVLETTEDAVQIVQPPLPLCPAIASLSPSGDASWWGTGFGEGNLGMVRDERWFKCVRESMELMSGILNRELPVTFLQEDLLPKCQQRAAVTLESSHPLGNGNTKETVTIQGASSLEVVFDVRTTMGSDDKISIFRGGNREPERVLRGLVGATESSLAFRRSPGSSSSAVAVAGIAVGDRVVRGPSWNWGEGHDGGPGGYGTVIEIRPWKGRPRSGIKVRWDDTSFIGLYRWDHEDCFDLLVVTHGSTSTKPVVIKGDTLSIQVEPEAISEPSSTKSSSDGPIPRLRLQSGADVSVKLKQSVGWDIFSGEFTLEAWFRIEANADGCLDSTQPLMSRGIMEGLNQIVVKAVANSDRRRSTVHVDMFAGDLANGLSLRGGSLTPGKWGHVAVAVDATGAAKLFVDSTEVASGMFQGTRMLLEDCDLVLGKSLDTDRTLNGYVYDFRLWSRALCAADVATGHKALRVAGSHGLFANFPFTEGQGEKLINRGYGSEVAAMTSAGCTWNESLESPAASTLSHWGWRCTVTPIFPVDCLDREGLPGLKEELEALRCLYGSGDARHDHALVRYVNSFAEKKSFDAERLLRCSWDDMTPSEENFVREPLLRELSLWRPPFSSSSATNTIPEAKTGARVNLSSPGVGVEETKGEEGILAETKEDGGKGTNGAQTKVGVIFDKKGSGIAARFEVLQQVNKKLRDALPYLDLTQMNRKGSAAHLLSLCRGFVFGAIKEPVLLSALSSTANADGGHFDLNLSRSKAAKHIHLGHTDFEGRWSVFGQAFRQMHGMHPRGLRTHSKLYNCVFMGERSQDAGGPYRESWSMYAQELQSTALPLLIHTPNGVHAAGVGRDRYVPNPGATSPDQVEMFVFLGKMMGHAMRSKEYLGLNLSVVVWKALVGQEVQQSDLENVDVLLTRSMQDIRDIDQKGVTRALFSDIVMENFTALSLDDREVELKPGGKNIPVTWDNRLEYADLVEKQRLTECCAMVKHIRKGMSMVIPLAVLGLFNWDEVETLVCGKPEVDVDLLEAIAEYSGCRKEQPHIKFFWQALREFSPNERSMLIKFTWGRTRLPLTAEGFSQRFKLQSFARSPADDYLPVAHTCFFSLELPAYSSLEVMKERLLFAAFNCSAIDGDDNFAGMNAAALGWDWDEEDEGEEA